jgi:hypothetical protein
VREHSNATDAESEVNEKHERIGAPARLIEQILAVELVNISLSLRVTAVVATAGATSAFAFTS